MLKDYNIAEKAGGVGKPIVETYADVAVTGTTLEIHLYWAGKGTTAIPDRGVYGPLISAITVTPSEFSCSRGKFLEFYDSISVLIKFCIVDFKIPGGGGLSTGAIVGIAVACAVALLLLILAILRFMGFLGGKDEENGKKLELACLCLFETVCLIYPLICRAASSRSTDGSFLFTANQGCY